MAGFAAVAALAWAHSLSTPVLAISDFEVRCTCRIEQQHARNRDGRLCVARGGKEWWISYKKTFDLEQALRKEASFYRSVTTRGTTKTSPRSFATALHEESIRSSSVFSHQPHRPRDRAHDPAPAPQVTRQGVCHTRHRRQSSGRGVSEQGRNPSKGSSDGGGRTLNEEGTHRGTVGDGATEVEGRAGGHGTLQRCVVYLYVTCRQTSATKLSGYTACAGVI